MKNKKDKFLGFTLAEVLIVMAIIGVVAALTIPVTLKNYRRSQLETALKKNYATLSQALIKAQVDYGSMGAWGLSWGSLDSNGSEVRFIKTYVAPYLNVAEASYNDKALKDFGYKEDIKTKTNKSFIGMELNSKPNMLRLADGTVYFISKSSSSLCPYGKEGPCLSTPDHTITVYVDTNGVKGPNVLGKDIFSYSYQIGGDRVYVGYERTTNINQDIRDYAQKNGLSFDEAFNELKSKGNFKPSWKEESISYLKLICYDKTLYNTEGFCGALIKKNGWKVPVDYPWL